MKGSVLLSVPSESDGRLPNSRSLINLLDLIGDCVVFASEWIGAATLMCGHWRGHLWHKLIVPVDLAVCSILIYGYRFFLQNFFFQKFFFSKIFFFKIFLF
jgi:hypothetical protein